MLRFMCVELKLLIHYSMYTIYTYELLKADWTECKYRLFRKGANLCCYGYKSFRLIKVNVPIIPKLHNLIENKLNNCCLTSTFFVQGLGIVIPWNIILTISDNNLNARSQTKSHFNLVCIIIIFPRKNNGRCC